MKKLLAVGSLAVLLGGCATSYMDGTSHNQLSSTTFSISAGANMHSYLHQENDMAMLRAAELACAKRYPYFRILSQTHKQFGKNDYTTMTIEVSKEKTPYDAAMIIKSMEGVLKSESRCRF